MQKQCKQCGANFALDQQDLDFYKKIAPKFGKHVIEMPLPTFCPDCRNQRRQMFRNDRSFYNRKCELSGKQFVSTFAPGTPYKIYHPDAWYSDKWDPMNFGRDFDFDRPFFDQFAELMRDVPRLGINIVNCENSYYCNFCSDNKDCYLDIAGEANRDCYFNLFVKYSKNVVDCTFVYNSELCYECINCYDCYNLQNSMYCENCSDCYFCFDLKGCRNCLFSSGLRNKQYFIFNKPYSEVDYKDYMSKLHMNSYEQRRKLYDGWAKFKAENAIFRANYFLNCENCSGNDIKNSKNTHYSFNVLNCWDCKYLYDVLDAKDCQDLNYSLYKPEFSCELISSLNMVKCAFSMESHYNNEVYYSEMLDNSANLFGCSALKHKSYCILNKQYNREEYEDLVPRIIEHMKKIGEFGEFFPVQISPFAYNETVAQEYFPLTKEQALMRGWRFKNEASSESKISDYKISDNINDVDDNICDKVLICEVSGKPYKIIAQEFKFYKRMGIPVPRRSPDQRHRDRIDLRTPRRLFERRCDKCGAGMQTPYGQSKEPFAPQKVLCEDCYLKVVY